MGWWDDVAQFHWMNANKSEGERFAGSVEWIGKMLAILSNESAGHITGLQSSYYRFGLISIDSPEHPLYWPGRFDYRRGRRFCRLANSFVATLLFKLMRGNEAKILRYRSEKNLKINRIPKAKTLWARSLETPKTNHLKGRQATPIIFHNPCSTQINPIHWVRYLVHPTNHSFSLATTGKQRLPTYSFH